MAGYLRLYCVGGLGGFLGADGINPIFFQILVGEGDRQWLEPHYFDQQIQPLGRIRTIIPEVPDHPNSLLDACIAFFPEYFSDCSLLDTVKQKVQKFERLDFQDGKDNIPAEWYALRKEALPIFKSLNIFEALLHELDLQQYGTDEAKSLARIAHK